MILYLDIETTSDHDKIHMACTLVEADDGTRTEDTHLSPDTLAPLVKAAKVVVLHGGVDFDLPVLRQVWGIEVELDKVFDTLLMSRLEMPDRKFGHSLESWGARFKQPKLDYRSEYLIRNPWAADVENAEWNDPDLPLMEEYCLQDVRITSRVYKHLVKKLAEQKFSPQSISLEHQVGAVISKQRRGGAYFDMEAAQRLHATLRDEYRALYKKIEDTFPPTKVEMKTKVKMVPFNPGSRQQIAERLMELGWKPTKFTEKAGLPVINDEVLGEIDIPEAKNLSRMFMLNSRIATIGGLIKAVDPRTGRIHGKISTNGAVTGRMTHFSPNLANIPAVSVEYGKEVRALFKAPPGKAMIGIDASGLELRMLAHYCKSPEYTAAIVDGDIHWTNAQALGLAPAGTQYSASVPALKQARDYAKTFIYAFIYGAGPAKIGSIVGGSAAEGKKLIVSFLERTPALARLRLTVGLIVKQKGSIVGLDGRRIHIRSEHSALNALLQGAGAILMKEALVIFNKLLEDHDYKAEFALNVHDEWQLYADWDIAEQVGRLGVLSIEEAGKKLGLRVPVTGEFNVGANWAETH